MKKINLEINRNYDCTSKYKYFIFLERGKEGSIYFTSKRKAEDILRLLHSILDDTLRGLFQINSKIYDIHMQYYFELKRIDCHKLKQCFEGFMFKAEYVFKTYSEGNSIIAVKSIKYLFNASEDALLILKKWGQHNKQYNLVNNCNGLFKLFDSLETTFYKNLNNELVSNNYKSKTLTVVYNKSIRNINF